MKTSAQRFFDRVDASEGCWNRTGYISPKGYSRFGRKRFAHRWVYEFVFGPIAPGLTIDHLCRNRRCVNPHHLEAVSPRTNVLRGVGITAVNSRKSACPAGHVYDSANTYVSRENQRMCRTCARDRQKARQQLYRALNPGPGIGSFNSSKTVCPSGHSYNAANTYVDRDGKRSCRSCQRERMRAIRGKAVTR